MKRIAIIGAGISGLCAAKIFLKAGFNVTVFEKAESIGGFWAKEKLHTFINHQATKDEYSFSDFKMPLGYPEHPSGEQVYEYLLNYCREFDLLKTIQLNHEVIEMDWNGRIWSLNIDRQDTLITESFHYVIICSGALNETKIPFYPNLQNFLANGGQVVHSSEVESIEQLKNKRVLVSGFAKSGTDVVSYPSGYLYSETSVYQNEESKLSRFLANNPHAKYRLYSRLSETLFNFHSETRIQKIAHAIYKSLIWLQLRGLELFFKWQYGLRRIDIIPERKTDEVSINGLGVETGNFYEKNGLYKIKSIQSSIKEYTNEGVLLTDGSKLKADLIIHDTSIIQDVLFLSPMYRSKLRDKNGRLRLYRNIISPEIPNIAFVGFNSNSFSPVNSEVAAYWVLRLVNEQIKLPSKEEMLESICSSLLWRMKESPLALEYSNTYISSTNHRNLEELLMDMGLRSKRTSSVIVG
ncbi:NAD(P)-binding domain-containing protein [Cytophagales bacterium LB-30]|uniref:NAD(P)-binding domain-containing protein n=1 Tax=Shiella aurantiaca TaxID=3058365 RepID=A0ABT8F3E7_9BACT|nr:NAD(P)-binding domain-containing protein [Shiella aurantiaca]MDN4164977.1 NAD(P)-binding domain-containing protein [Shiella aurantiaca]